MKSVKVLLGTRSYSIHYEKTVSALVRAGFKGLKPTRIVLLTDSHVGPLYAKTVERELARYAPVVKIIIPAGERHKTLATAQKIYPQLAKHRVDRKSLLVALGGGVVGDLGGFVAATWLRGISWIGMPTTLLAMVDSSIGGKTGVDLPEGKNLVGAFHQPRAVLCFLPFLKTLPAPEFRSGLGEVIKYGMICSAKLFHKLERDVARIQKRDAKTLAEIVHECGVIKARVAGQDEFETLGLRRILNFGHTLGHAVEQLTGYKNVTHGEAVGLGMLAAVRFSANRGLCSRAIENRLERLLAAYELPRKWPSFPRAGWLSALGTDKKGEGGKIHFVFLEKIGKVTAVPVTPLEILDSLKF